MATFNTVTWTPLTPLTAQNLQIMMDNTQYLKDQLTSYPLGVICAGRCPVSNSGVNPIVVTSSETAIPGMGCSGTIGTNRLIKVTWTVRSLNPTGANDVYQVYVKMGGNVIGRINVLAAASTVGQAGGTGICLVNSPTAGAYSFQVYAQRITSTIVPPASSDTTSAYFESGSDSQPVIIVEDLGQALSNTY